MNGYDVVVVGAGIVGCAVARECARAGMRVAVVEGGRVAGAATSAGMGHVVVMDDSAAQLALTMYSRGLWRDETLPAAAEYETPGTIWVAADEEEMAAVAGKRAVYEGAGVACRVVSGAELAAAEPNLRAGLKGGLLVPEDGVVSPPAAAAYYLAEARKLGAEIVMARAGAAGEGVVRLEDGSELRAERIVLAVGVECDLLAGLAELIKGRKGQLVKTVPCAGFVRHQLVELGYLKSAHGGSADSVAFNVQPRQKGHVLIGSSRQYGSADGAVEAAILERMLERAYGYMPGLKGIATERVWTGFRAATPDKLPLLGPAAGLSDDSSLWLAAGFEGLGTTNAPGAARLLVDQMLGQQTAIAAEPYLPGRMALQGLNSKFQEAV